MRDGRLEQALASVDSLRAVQDASPAESSGAVEPPEVAAPTNSSGNNVGPPEDAGPAEPSGDVEPPEDAAPTNSSGNVGPPEDDNVTLRVPVVDLAGKEVAVLDASPSWGLPEVLPRIREQSGLECPFPRILHGKTELLPGASLKEIGVVDGAQLTLIQLQGIVATAGGDSTAKVWDAATGECLRTYNDDIQVISVAFSPIAACLATATPAHLRIWDMTSDKCIHELHGHIGGVIGLAFSPDGLRIASFGEIVVKLWDTATGDCIWMVHGPLRLTDVAFCPRGVHIATASDDHKAKIWEAASGECVRTLEGHDNQVWCVAFSPAVDELQLVATGSLDRTVMLWDVGSGERVGMLDHHFPGSVGGDAVSSVAFTPDGTRLASAAEKLVRIWMLASGECVLLLSGHEAAVKSLSFSRDGLWLASASWRDHTARVWNVAEGTCVRVLEGHGDEIVHCVAFSPHATCDLAATPC